MFSITKLKYKSMSAYYENLNALENYFSDHGN